MARAARAVRSPTNHHFKHLLHKLHCTHSIYCRNREEKMLKIYFQHIFLKSHIFGTFPKLGIQWGLRRPFAVPNEELLLTNMEEKLFDKYGSNVLQSLCFQRFNFNLSRVEIFAIFLGTRNI